MSSRLNMNPIPIIPWKGQTFNQIVSHIKKNGNVHSNELGNMIFSSLPLKTYRRELASSACSSSRNTTTIDEINRPGGTVVKHSSSQVNSLVNVLDFNLTVNSSENIAQCNAECVVGTPETNARRRVRSSGMIKKQFDLSNDKPKYYTDNRQYLKGRNLTFEQNNFHYIRTGDNSATPGTTQSIANTYTTNNATDCKRYYVSENMSFSYQWVAGNPIFADTGSEPVNNEVPGQYGNFTVTLEKGFYDTSDINNVLHAQMIKNEHFFVDNRTKAKRFFINFVFNSTTSLIELQIEPISKTILSNLGLSKPIIQISSTPGTRDVVWTVPTSTQMPMVNILETPFRQVIGFTSGQYPPENKETQYIVSSTNVPAIRPRFNKVFYKPNNPQFAQQGAVTSSSRIARLRYNAITNSASTYRNAYGKHVANALAYGVPENGYTIKDKIGYPLPNTPKFTSTGEQRNCKNVSISG